MSREEREVPILTDVVQLRATPAAGLVATRQAGLSAASLDALQAELVSRTTDLTAELLHNASREMEAVLFERVLDRLKTVLPGLVDEALRQYTSQARDG